jgi:hypothetical protein
MNDFDEREQFFIGLTLLIRVDPCRTVDPECARYILDVSGSRC